MSDMSSPMLVRATIVASLALALAGCAQDVGLATEPIVGGTTGGDPAVVWLYNTSSGGLCTGTLIEPRVVLTAKHCVQQPGATAPSPPGQFYVGIGDQAGRGTTLRVQSVYTTPGVWTESSRGGLDGSLIGSDVAVMVLASGVTSVTPIPIRRESPSGLSGRTITATGFGQIPSGSAGRKYTAMGRVTGVSGNLIYVGALTCQGDSGGPMITEDRTVAGVVSFGSGGCGSGYGAYNAIHNYLDLIDLAIEEGGGCINDGAERCDGRDNDCDDAVDETCTPIGEPCGIDDECVGNTCRDTVAGRICTVGCDARRPSLGCSEGLHCARTGEFDCDGFCVPTRSTDERALDADCDSDDQCASRFCANPGDGRRRCLAPCAQDAGGCYAGDVCVAHPGACGGCVPAEIVSGLRHGLGEPCANDADCGSGICIEDAGSMYCSRSCDATSACPSAYHCRAVGMRGTMCVRGAVGGLGEACVDNADCRSGICASRGSQRWCTQICTETAPCPDAFDCVDVGPGSLCAPNTGLVGDDCATAADCISGICEDPGTGLICTRECGVDAPCGPGFECRLDMRGAPRCLPPRPPAPVSGGGCAVGSRESPAAWMWSVGLAVALGLRRRARRGGGAR